MRFSILIFALGAVCAARFLRLPSDFYLFVAWLAIVIFTTKSAYLFTGIGMPTFGSGVTWAFSPEMFERMSSDILVGGLGILFFVVIGGMLAFVLMPSLRRLIVIVDDASPSTRRKKKKSADEYWKVA